MATSNGVTVKRTGLDRLLKRLAILERKEVKWGFFGARYGPENDNMYVATIANLQQTGREAGSGFAYIPPRRFFYENVARISTGMDTQGLRLNHLLGQAVGATMTGMTDASAFVKIGKHLQESLQDEILAFDTPPNAAFTIKMKDFDDPLIHTGKMYDSVEYKVVLKRKNKEE